MKSNKRRHTRKTVLIILWSTIFIMGIFALGLAVYLHFSDDPKIMQNKPDDLLLTYMNYIPEQKYAEMYQMIDTEASGNICLEDFIQRNSAIYEGIEIQNLEVKILSYQEDSHTVQYLTTFDTVAGTVRFENEASFLQVGDNYRLVWDDTLIYPNLYSADKVRVSTISAKRGEILDRNGRVLAGEGIAASVGIVPGRLEHKKCALKQISQLLDIEVSDIKRKLAAKWIKDDSFVPIQTIRKVKEIELMTQTPDEDVLKEQERQQQLLKIPGVMICDTKVRTYPLADAAAHLVGYVQNVTAEDLDAHAGEGYTANSVIGRSGAEGLFESELKGEDGCRIYIVDTLGNEKEELAHREVMHGKSITLTIDAQLQRSLYTQFKEDKGCCTAINPYTGEVLALVSTPSYDNNDFVMGMSDQKWQMLNDDEDKPMYNRFRQVWCPGSTLKPVIAAIGLESETVDPYEDYGNEGLRWQKDASWGSYYVTTLHAYEPVILENALIYSDNIYFAKAALKIGAKNLKDSFLQLGFQEDLPFEVTMPQSQYSNTTDIETEIQLADSGYGQGQILINPLHLACIYSAFCNQGNIIKPYFVKKQNVKAEYWIAHAFSSKTAEVVLEAMKKIVNDPHGTGYAAHREDILLAGKTGTAEIKASQEDTSGTELGWFAVFSADPKQKHPLLLVNMVEDVKERGGSGYVVEKDRQVLENWFTPS